MPGSLWRCRNQSQMAAPHPTGCLAAASRSLLVLLLSFGTIGARAGPSTSLDEAIASGAVVMFTLDSCPFCRRAEAALRKNSIDFKKVPIGPYKQALKARTGKSSAPSTWIHGEFVGGCNDGTLPWHGVLPLLANGRFQKMLLAAGGRKKQQPAEAKVEGANDPQQQLHAMTGGAGGHLPGTPAVQASNHPPRSQKTTEL